MTAKEFYNKKAFKYQLKRAITHDHSYFADCIIKIMEEYAQQQVKNIANKPLLTITDDALEKSFFELQELFADANKASADNGIPFKDVMDKFLESCNDPSNH